jgi:hypothetical protein
MFRKHFFLVLAGAGIVAALSGCGGGSNDTSSSSSPASLRKFIVFVDMTTSMSPKDREESRNLTINAVNSLDEMPNVQIVPFWNQESVEDLNAAYDETPESPDSLETVFDDEVIKKPAIGEKGTNYGPLFEWIAREANDKKTSRIDAIIVSDGGFSDQEPTTKGVSKLKKQGKLGCIFVAPVKTLYRSKIQRELQPLGDERVIIRTGLDAVAGLTELEKKLE